MCVLSSPAIVFDAVDQRVIDFIVRRSSVALLEVVVVDDGSEVVVVVVVVVVVTLSLPCSM